MMRISNGLVTWPHSASIVDSHGTPVAPRSPPTYVPTCRSACSLCTSNAAWPSSSEERTSRLSRPSSSSSPVAAATTSPGAAVAAPTSCLTSAPKTVLHCADSGSRDGSSGAKCLPPGTAPFAPAITRPVRVHHPVRPVWPAPVAPALPRTMDDRNLIQHPQGSPRRRGDANEWLEDGNLKPGA